METGGPSTVQIAPASSLALNKRRVKEENFGYSDEKIRHEGDLGWKGQPPILVSPSAFTCPSVEAIKRRPLVRPSAVGRDPRGFCPSVSSDPGIIIRTKRPTPLQ